MADTNQATPAIGRYLDRTSWRIAVQGEPPNWPRRARPWITFPELAQVARGLGFLNAEPDLDGLWPCGGSPARGEITVAFVAEFGVPW